MRFVQLSILLLFSFVASAQSSETDIFDPNHISEIRLTIKQQNYADILDSLKVYGAGMIVGDVNINGTKIKDVGIRYRGNSSYGFGNKRNPWQIKLDYINKSQKYQGVSSIKLSSALRDPSMVREVLGFEIARKYMVAPRANYTKLYVNDKYIGLYVNVESIDKNFIERNNASRSNTFFKCSPDPDTKSNPGCKNKIYSALVYEQDPNCFLPNYTLISESGWDELIELTKVLEQSPANINSMLDVDQTLWMLAYNNVFVNLSSYSGKECQNYYLYKNNFGKFVPVIWDLNLAFGSYKNTKVGTSDLTLKELQELDPLLHIDDIYKPLISRLLSIKENRMVYLAHIRQLFEEIVISDYLEKRAEELQKLIRKAYLDDPYKQYSVMEFDKSLTTTIGSKTKIPGIMELMQKRLKYLRKHDLLKNLPSEVTNVTYRARQLYSNEQIQTFTITAETNNFPKKLVIYYRPDAKSDYQSATMYDDGTNSDETAGDGKYTVVIDPKSMYNSMEYYIQTENTGAVGFYPNNYVLKPAVVTLAELNK
ncbi:MAG TPA: CotH kinase family protein [Saprospiraceae bacterium]|nr:CotH kinase family protein [Saprospiraceae bacterium]MCC6689886.1 CotH kinase family protein [Saprospiraceae bacterium]HMV23557.1 CotH kinase family protein [Saprospiraceae bacterium]HMZ72846.1 CotH kinase family protein [Saprospiraceae bacterium]HNA40875.1 CotH kinase family protein [Saprospiraceae bacterium]